MKVFSECSKKWLKEQMSIFEAMDLTESQKCFLNSLKAELDNRKMGDCNDIPIRSG